MKVYIIFDYETDQLIGVAKNKETAMSYIRAHELDELGVNEVEFDKWGDKKSRKEILDTFKSTDLYLEQLKNKFILWKYKSLRLGRGDI